jgi:hypothetical protein
MTQREKVLLALEKSGSAGATNFELNGICFRYGARIKDLRDEGHNIITVKGKKKSEWRFILSQEPKQLELLK